MKFIDGYILITLIIGITSLANHLGGWDIKAIWILSPIIFYIGISLVITVIKQIIKTKD